MRIHADNLDRSDLVETLPPNVHVYITPRGSRKRARAFDVTLYVFDKDDLHRRFGNSGRYGASTDVAATWDEWGVWIARLFERDPAALIGYYKSPEHFRDETEGYARYVACVAAPSSLARHTHSAPWLKTAERMV